MRGVSKKCELAYIIYIITMYNNLQNKKNSVRYNTVRPAFALLKAYTLTVCILLSCSVRSKRFYV